MTPERVQIGVLGQVTVTRGDDDVPIGSTKQRTVLAILAAHPDGPVGVDRLVEILWPDRAPASARANVQTFIHRLRALLGAESIVSGPGGYRWSGPAEDSDAALFERAVADGRSAREAGDESLAAAHYRAGLARWRGPAFDGLTEIDVLRVEAARLDELRLIALQECFDCELVLGRHRTLIPELLTVIADHPLQEHFLAQAMTALHGAGRSSDALALFARGRERLADEIGVDPGAELRQLHQRILAETAGHGHQPVGPADLPDSAAGAVMAGHPSPAQLPAVSPAFVGREQDIDALVEALQAPGPAPGSAVITGAGGVGKSTLAIRAAHRMVEYFPDGQLYVDLRGATPGMSPLQPIEVLTRFVRALQPGVGITSGELDEVSARFRSLLAGRRILLVLDDAADVAQLRPLLPGHAGCAVLITSRKPLATIDGAYRLRIGELSTAQGLRLLGALAGDQRVADEPAASADVVRWCDHLPLAICLAGAKLAGRPHWTVRNLRDRLAADDTRLNEFEVEDRGLRRSLALSSADLSRAGAELFALLGCLPTPEAGLPVVAAAAGITEQSAQPLLDELVDAQLIEAGPGGRYRLHDLVRLFARDRAESGDLALDVPACLRRILHLYLATAADAAVHFQEPNPWRWRHLPATLIRDPVALDDADAVRSWYTAELPTMVDIAARAAIESVELAGLVIALATAQRPMLTTLGRWREALALAESIRVAAQTTGDPVHRAQADHELALLLSYCGRAEDGLEHGKRAVAFWRDSGDRVGEAHGLMALAVGLRVLDRHDDLLTILRQSLAMQRESGDRMGEEMALVELGLCQLRRGDLAASRAAHLQAEEIARELDLGRHRAVILGNLAEIDRRAGDLDAAVAAFEQVLVLDQHVGMSESVSQAEHLWGLGRTLQQRAGERRSIAGQDDAGRARTCRHRSAEVLAAVGLISDDERRQIVASADPPMPQALEMAF